jgi:hypothetical protein
MLVIAPSLPQARWAQVVAAVVAIALSTVAVKVGKSVRTKMIIAKRLDKSLPGPKGHFLFGLAPVFYKNLHRLYDYQAEMTALYGGRFKEPWGLMTNNTVYVRTANFNGASYEPNSK